MDDAIMFLNGYMHRQDDQWRQTREITYMIYCSATDANGRESIYEFMPLEGDPTKEELAASKKAKLKKRAERQKITMENLLKQGVIKKTNGRRNSNTN